MFYLLSISKHGEKLIFNILALPCVLVAAIIEKARKFLKKLLAQFSTKLNKFFIKFWEYLETKSTIIHMKNVLSPKNEENAIFFQETVATNFIKQITKVRILPFLHEAATVSEKKIIAF